ncbi:MAG: GTPase Era [Anaerolineae bacterium]
MDSETTPLLPEESPPDHRSGFAAVVGAPNVGKSTLVNQLVSQKVSIVSDKPQTTRRRLRGILTRPDAQAIFVDTPGFHEPKNVLGEYMVGVARRAAAEVDLILFVVDVSRRPTRDDRLLAELLTKTEALPLIQVLNKVDLLAPHQAEENTGAHRELASSEVWVLTSATRGDHLDQLLEIVLEQLPPGPRYFPEDQVSDQETRFVAGELIRERALALLRQEVPHGIAVVVEEWTDRTTNLTYIEAVLHVEKESHKGIALGEGGKTIKQIGSAARREIEALVGHQIYLDLRVKVAPRWRRDPVALQRLGYR